MSKFVPLRFWVVTTIVLFVAITSGIDWLMQIFPTVNDVIGSMISLRILIILVWFIIALIVILNCWKFVWKSPYLGPYLSEKIFPDLNGQWIVKLQSNFSIIEKMRKCSKDQNNSFDLFEDGVELPPLLELEFEIRIIQKWFKTEVLFIGKDGSVLSGSRTLSVEFHQDLEGGKALTWIYKQTNKEGNSNPMVQTDQKDFLGAGLLKVIDGGRILDGHYWQNRSWHLGLNAAGLILAERKTKTSK